MTYKRFKLFWIIAAAFLLPAASASAAPVKILALGTSLTQGYGLPPGTEIPAVLQDALKKKGIDATVINAGVSGDTSISCLWPLICSGIMKFPTDAETI